MQPRIPAVLPGLRLRHGAGGQITAADGSLHRPVQEALAVGVLRGGARGGHRIGGGGADDGQPLLGVLPGLPRGDGLLLAPLRVPPPLDGDPGGPDGRHGELLGVPHGMRGVLPALGALRPPPAHPRYGVHQHQVRIAYAVDAGQGDHRQGGSQQQHHPDRQRGRLRQHHFRYHVHGQRSP
jgi:hypothetical protein